MATILTAPATGFSRAVVIDGEMSGQFIQVNTETLEWMPEDDMKEADRLLSQIEETATDISAMFQQMRQDGDVHRNEMARLRKERDELFRAIEATH
jgi:hypothetical protein